jgi:hypothetical protein
LPSGASNLGRFIPFSGLSSPLYKSGTRESLWRSGWESYLLQMFHFPNESCWKNKFLDRKWGKMICKMKNHFPKTWGWE